MAGIIYDSRSRVSVVAFRTVPPFGGLSCFVFYNKSFGKHAETHAGCGYTRRLMGFLVVTQHCSRPYFVIFIQMQSKRDTAT